MLPPPGSPRRPGGTSWEGLPDTHHLRHLLQVGLGVLVPLLRGHQQALLVALHVAKDDGAALLPRVAQDAGRPPQVLPRLQVVLVELHGRERTDALVLRGRTRARAGHLSATLGPRAPTCPRCGPRRRRDGRGRRGAGGAGLTMRYCVSSM